MPCCPVAVARAVLTPRHEISALVVLPKCLWSPVCLFFQMLLDRISRLESASYNLALTHVQSPGGLACLFSLCSRARSGSPADCLHPQRAQPSHCACRSPAGPPGTLPSGSPVAIDLQRETPLSSALVWPLFSHVSTARSLPAPALIPDDFHAHVCKSRLRCRSGPDGEGHSQGPSSGCPAALPEVAGRGRSPRGCLAHPRSFCSFLPGNTVVSRPLCTLPASCVPWQFVSLSDFVCS